MRHLRKRLAVFLREKRGEMTLREFSKKYGLSKDTANRIENCDQNVTIDTLEHFCKVFKCDIGDLFPSTNKNRP